MKVMDSTHQTIILSHQTDPQYLNRKIILMKFANLNTTVVHQMKKRFKTRMKLCSHRNHFKLKMKTSIQISPSFKALKVLLSKNSFLITDSVRFQFSNLNLLLTNSFEIFLMKTKSCRIKSQSFWMKETNLKKSIRIFPERVRLKLNEWRSIRNVLSILRNKMNFEKRKLSVLKRPYSILKISYLKLKNAFENCWELQKRHERNWRKLNVKTNLKLNEWLDL